jgi:hypothetical protein
MCPTASPPPTEENRLAQRFVLLFVPRQRKTILKTYILTLIGVAGAYMTSKTLNRYNSTTVSPSAKIVYLENIGFVYLAVSMMVIDPSLLY